MAIYSEPYKRCGKMVCITPKEAQRAVESKIDMLNWMRQANALFCYYEVREGKNVCAFTSGAISSQ